MMCSTAAIALLALATPAHSTAAHTRDLGGFMKPRLRSNVGASVIKDPRSAVVVTTCRTRSSWDKGPWEYLFVQRSKPPHAGSWSVPSGKVNFGEGILKAAAREIAEETNLTANKGLRLHPSPLGTSEFSFPIDSSLVGSVLGVHLPTWVLPTGFHYSIEATAMFAFATEPDAPVIAGDDAANARWVTLNELEQGHMEVNKGKDTIAFLKNVEQMLASGALQPNDALAVGSKQLAPLQLFETVAPGPSFGGSLMWICFSVYVFTLSRAFFEMSVGKSEKSPLHSNVLVFLSVACPRAFSMNVAP